jgi:hypothetical protein
MIAAELPPPAQSKREQETAMRTARATAFKAIHDNDIKSVAETKARARKIRAEEIPESEAQAAEYMRDAMMRLDRLDTAHAKQYAEAVTKLDEEYSTNKDLLEERHEKASSTVAKAYHKTMAMIKEMIDTRCTLNNGELEEMHEEDAQQIDIIYKHWHYEHEWDMYLQDRKRIYNLSDHPRRYNVYENEIKYIEHSLAILMAHRIEAGLKDDALETRQELLVQVKAERDRALLEYSGPSQNVPEQGKGFEAYVFEENRQQISERLKRNIKEVNGMAKELLNSGRYLNRQQAPRR